MKQTEIDKLVDTLLKKVANKKPKKLVKHAKKIKKIRKAKAKKTNKKQALDSQFNYANLMLQHYQKMLGLPVTNMFNVRRRHNLKRMSQPRVNQLWNNTQMKGTQYLSPQTYNDFHNIYRNMAELDWVDKQQQEYKKYNNEHYDLQYFKQNLF